MSESVPVHILIVDDDERLQNSLQFFFQGKGYRATQARTKAQAMETIVSCRTTGTTIDLLITDIDMPEIDGENLIRILRVFDATIPVLVMTGFGHLELFTRLMKIGCTDYLDKPFRLDEMETHVELMLKKIRHGSAGRVR